MRVSQTGPAWVTIGAMIALLVVILALLGALGVVPFTAPVVFGLILALGVARLV